MTAALVGLLIATQEPIAVDLSRYDEACGVRIRRSDRRLQASWSADGYAFHVDFNLVAGEPLVRRISRDGSHYGMGGDLEPRFSVTVGTRVERANERYIFFDKPVDRPHEAFAAARELKSVRVESAGKRASIAFSKLAAGPFSGELVVRIYDGSPLLHFEAAMAPERSLAAEGAAGLSRSVVAYVYDFVLEGAFKRFRWKDTQDRWVEAEPRDVEGPIAVRHRTMVAEAGDEGTLAIFPPPHGFFYPRDYTDNFRFMQAGARRFGLRQDVAGGAGHKGAFIPWVDAPVGKIQRMGAFVLLGEGHERALERVLRYTHGDAFKPMDGRVTMTSHWHLRLAVSELAGRPHAPEVARVFKQMNVNVVHLAEFHGDPGSHPNDTGEARLREMKAMFDVCRKYSDERLLWIPGEEANAQLNQPPPAGTHPGHWVYLFPKPVYLTLKRAEGQPLVETIEPYGTVYHAGSEADMLQILRREKALAWTAHPRIKASFACPDAYKEREFFKDPLWFGGAWKAMPADLSEPRLGVRVLDLLDDMNHWGVRKQILGEVDCFELDRTHELYASMNVNYLRLPRIPSFDDWSGVLEVLRRGDYFTTTGEVLIHSFEVKAGRARADLEWTFPLANIELVTSDGKKARRRTIVPSDTTEFGRRTFEWPLDPPDAAWARLEAWDVATNGAFTPPLWLR
jgi:hypothetical protein